ncbi:hypothetical protein G7007_06900 [Pseudomonas entomophila]|jgi:hypothetical protein|uniref:hypothetical protein n=1 Tax=Pseudomonas entomophila TaxID=312306 RepID=UPI0015E34879|nr:hypothetical protein [Pseudomonas entomophila]MBA1192589.1 hypothetical protein [Pseudomonas entomophila]
MRIVFVFLPSEGRQRRKGLCVDALPSKQKRRLAMEVLRSIGAHDKTFECLNA